ncbi:MAG: MerR family transcriptional regulator, partial [Acidimicrobiia bacterium]
VYGRGMESYTIGEAAQRSGFRASALRYYEQHGLLDPAGRTDAGYRLYDDSSLERLQFIARAKELGCTLEEISDLAELWVDDACAPVQARLHELVTTKIADAQRRSNELIRFTAQLQTAAAHLGDEPIDGRCSDRCACLGVTGSSTGPEPVVLGERADPQIACSLPADAMPDRAEEWQAIAGHVQRRQPLADGAGVRLVLDHRVPMEQLAKLATAEHECCSFFAFTITVDDRGIALEVRAPEEAAEIVTAMFGAAA